MRFVNLWQWQGRVDRGAYLAVGAVAMILKWVLDNVIATGVFHRSWAFWLYGRPFGPAASITSLHGADARFAAVMLGLALPFIWLGLAMTAKRLRDAAQPVWLVCLFFVPLLNALFFVILCLLPSAGHQRVEEAAPWPGPRSLDRWFPRTQLGSALFAIFLTAVIGFAFAALGTAVPSYGWGLFVALPFCLGLFAVLLHSYREPRTFGICMSVATLPLLIIGGALLVAAIEGIICVLMAAPLALALAVLGGFFGYAIQSAHWLRKGTPAALSIALLLTPSLFSVEHILKPQPSTFVVKSAIEVNAPPERVWKEVVAFTEIAPPQELIFRAGIAYPIRAEISGHGPGAIRHCVFSTGPFVEPIIVWDEPRLLRFSVTANPAPMNELTPYAHIEPPHLHGYFESHQGQFLLTALPGNRTRLEGTTWYTHTMWPETYWHWWSDYVIHRIHLRVLNHIKARVESGHLP